MKMVRAAVLAVLAALLAPAALKAGPPTWPSLDKQLQQARVVPGSALDTLIRKYQDFSKLRVDEMDDQLPYPPWLRLYWRTMHPEGVYSASDATKGYPLVLKEIFEWMVSHQNLLPGPGIGAEPEDVGGISPLTVAVGTNTNVSGTQSAPRSESDIRLNFWDPLKVVSASNNIASSGQQGQYWSTDGGTTWGRTLLALVSGDQFHSDPTVDWTSDGTAWSTTIGIQGGGSTLRMRSYLSTDSGATWAFETTFSGAQTSTDKQMMWADHSATSAFKDRIYAIWHNGLPVFVNRRTAGVAGTWLATPLQISGAESTGTGIGGDVKTNSAGDVFAFWPTTGNAKVFVAKSTNGGDAWAAPVQIATTFDTFDIQVPSMPNRHPLIYVSGGAYKAGIKNNVYATWTDLSGITGCTTPANQPGTNVSSACTTRVWFARSTDGGGSWTAGYKLNEDGGKHDQYNQWLAVDETTGELGIIYYDTIADSGRKKTDVYYQSSFDDGVSWTCPVKVTTAQTDETASGADTGNEYGDYNALSGYAATFFPSWTDRRGGGFEQVYTAKITTSPEPGPAATGSISVPGNNQIQVTWGAGVPAAPSYAVFRAVGTCLSHGPYVQIATPAASPYVDTTVSGGVTYAYQVASLDANGCEVAPRTTCLEATATGVCNEAPNFAGISSVTNAAAATCTLNLAWNAATPLCSGPVAYTIYRSTTAGFVPAPANQIASGVSGTTYPDASGLVSGTRYYYVVRATDLSDGQTETNNVHLSGVPLGPLAPQSFSDTFEGGMSGGGFDNAGWTHAFLTGSNDWTWSTAQSQSPTHSWFAQDIGSVSDSILATPPFVPTAGSTLTFFHTFAFEGSVANCYDAGTLEVSTDGGGSWTVVPGGSFTSGGYNGTVNTNFSNPLAGKAAWCSGTIGALTSVSVNLAAYAGLGTQIRWHEGNDSSVTATGWYVDSVAITGASFYSSCTTGATGPKFYTLTPCRVLDTRNPAGPLGGPALVGSASRNFALAGTCGIPTDALQAVVNVTVVNTTTPGDLRIFAAGTAMPGTSVINFQGGQVRANNAIVGLSTDATGSITVQNDGAGTTDFILDVNGFFR